jgi:hypothetical protein
MARKATQPAATETIFNMTAQVEVATAEALNDALLGDLLDQLGDDSVLESLEAAGLDDDLSSLTDEIVEAAGDDDIVAGEATIEAADALDVTIAADAGDVTDALLDEIAEDAEREGAKQALYAEQDGQPTVTDATPPESDPTEVADAATGKGKKGGRKKNNVAAAGDETAPKEPKAPRATSVTHAPGDLLVAKLGEKAKDFLMLRLSDAELDEEALKARQAEFVNRMNDRDAIADKVREKMQMFMLWLTKGGNLNEVLKRALTVLHSQGELTSGDKGNLQLNLLSKPYSIGTARSQANQMFMAFPELGLTIKEKGRMVANPDSALLPMAYTMLGLA